jgi:hypothetical protein
MGANTIRLWGWNNTADHTDFFSTAYNDGTDPIYVIVTFWMEPSAYPDISSTTARARIKSDFREMVAANKNYPGVLMWAIGNELNAPWMYGDRFDDLFSLINEMAQEAHLEEEGSPHPVTAPLADIDLLDTIDNYDSAMSYLDVWSVQVFRGISFGSLFKDYEGISAKPLIITEYGIDAYDTENGDEYEKLGVSHQAIYAEALWEEVETNSDICCGSSIMEYCDEWWKGKYGYPPDYDPWLHSAAGYPTESHPDGYSNEEWWGVMRTKDNGSEPDIMEPRVVYHTLQLLWDSTPPTIGIPSRTPIGDIEPEQQVTISVNVVDNGSGVNNVDLFYNINNGENWEKVAMNYSIPKNAYEAPIPGQHEETRVKFRIVAYDHAGNNANDIGAELYCTYFVIGEFPSVPFLSLFAIATLLSVILYRKKQGTRSMTSKDLSTMKAKSKCPKQ